MRVEGNHWTDGEGRRLVLRGANLGGDCKVPKRPDGDTRLKAGFYEAKGVSFVGRPFALEEAEEHFARLKRWGLNFHRLLVTWEAVEHDGPGIYDEEYLDYLETRRDRPGRGHGISLRRSPPGRLEPLDRRRRGADVDPRGRRLRPERLFASGAAHLNQELGADYPRMTWFSNYNRLACATMWTLFFAGDAFAPGIGPVGSGPTPSARRRRSRTTSRRTTSRPWRRVAESARALPLRRRLRQPQRAEPGFHRHGGPRERASDESSGAAPTPWQAIMAGLGLSRRRCRSTASGALGSRRSRRGLGGRGIRAWKDGVECVWRRAGVWDLEGGGPSSSDPVTSRPSQAGQSSPSATSSGPSRPLPRGPSAPGGKSALRPLRRGGA